MSCRIIYYMFKNVSLGAYVCLFLFHAFEHKALNQTFLRFNCVQTFDFSVQSDLCHTGATRAVEVRGCISVFHSRHLHFFC